MDIGKISLPEFVWWFLIVTAWVEDGMHRLRRTLAPYGFWLSAGIVAIVWFAVSPWMGTHAPPPTPCRA